MDQLMNMCMMPIGIITQLLGGVIGKQVNKKDISDGIIYQYSSFSSEGRGEGFGMGRKVNERR